MGVIGSPRKSSRTKLPSTPFTWADALQLTIAELAAAAWGFSRRKDTGADAAFCDQQSAFFKLKTKHLYMRYSTGRSRMAKVRRDALVSELGINSPTLAKSLINWFAWLKNCLESYVG